MNANYYKIIQNGEVVGVGYMFAKWSIAKRKFFYCAMQDANVVQNVITEKYYQTDWLEKAPVWAVYVEDAEVVLIAFEEYEELYELLIDGETVPEPEPEPEPAPEPAPTPEPSPEPEHRMTVQEMREKIAEQDETIGMLTECLLEMSEIVYGGEL